ncbi:hypothetical protein [Novosphingobium sp. MBES04]|uniref:hypothetical protein n=1 Tax=Novosphingobium sp. MBES04 TaxID=1206458 RepID=UPI00057FC338|nr:hypothetical protein [Novosphingobium sp. MBES04]GAM04836.1 hypothetical protein MBENS4_1834 [Novosphingobium sp. MBES04]
MTVAGIDLREIDEQAICGRYQLVFGGGQFAVVRFVDMRWRFSSGKDLDFRPTHYLAPEAA